jgi:vacuolar-type H+-ATPase subunit E/Vma4
MPKPEKMSDMKMHGSHEGGKEEASASVRAFCERIRKDAQEEIERTLGKAELSSKKKLEEMEKRGTSLVRQATETAETQAKGLEAKAMADVALELRRTALKAQGEIVEEVLARVREKLRELKGSDDYRDFLKALAAQGIAVLGEDGCVLAPGKEDADLFTPEFVRAVEKSVGKELGRTIKVRVSPEQGVKGQGVRVYSESGTVLFDNMLESRMERLGDELRGIIAREVFSQDATEKEHYDGLGRTDR